MSRILQTEVDLALVLQANGLFMMKGISLAILVSFLGLTAAPQLAQANPDLLRPAAVAAQHSRYQEAEAVWQRISVRNPASAEAYYNLGIAQTNQQKWEAAIESYGQAIVLEPDFVHAYFNLGQAQARLGRYQAATQSYRRVLALDPQEGWAEELLAELEIIARGSGIDWAILIEQSS